MTEAEDSPLKGKSPMEKAKLIDAMIERETKRLQAELDEERARRLRVVALHLAMIELKSLDPKQAMTPAMVRYHDARRALKPGDLKASP